MNVAKLIAAYPQVPAKLLKRYARASDQKASHSNQKARAEDRRKRVQKQIQAILGKPFGKQ
jgi:hypothetical protein